MRYYARAFPPAGGTTGAWAKVVHLVRASTRLLLLVVASKIRSDDVRPRVPGRAARHARARLPGRQVHAGSLRAWHRAGSPRRVLVVRRFLQGTGRTPAELLDRPARAVRLPDICAAVSPGPAQGISKTVAGET